MELSRENMRKLRQLFLFAAVVIVCLWKYEISLRILSFAWKVILPFVIGGAIAFVLNVPMNFIQRRLFGEKENGKMRGKFARPVSILIVLFLMTTVIGLILFVLIPQLGSTFSNLGQSIQIFIPELQQWIGRVFHDNKEIMNLVNEMEFDWNRIVNAAMDFFENGAGNVVDSTITVAKNIANGVATFFIAFAFAIYILMQKEKLKRQAKLVLFAFVRRGRAEAVLEVCVLTYRTFSNFLTGQCVEALILGGMFVITMVIFQLPYALLIGILIAFTALVPIFGAFIGCVVGAFLIFMVTPVKAVAFIVIFLVLQQIEGNLIYPHVVGNSVGLPSIWVLAAVSIGARLMGVVGMLIFIPIISVFYALFREVVYLKLRKREIDPGEIV